MKQGTRLSKTSNDYLRSPLRYPGGKQRSIPFLSQVMRKYREGVGIREFREPFLGGGSVLLYAISEHLAQSYWGNDANELLMDFWRQVQEDAEALCTKVEELKEPYDGPRHKSSIWTAFRDEYTKKLNALPSDRLHRAARFFALNRSTSSGATESGGLTPQAYCERFTDSSIERLRQLHQQLAGIRFTCENYSRLLQQEGEAVFIFLDPPYYTAERSGLYGKNGNLHKGFNHELLASELQQCQHPWLMTIDDSPPIRSLYNWAETYPWAKAYGMTNVGGNKSKKGAELLVANFAFQHFFQTDFGR